MSFVRSTGRRRRQNEIKDSLRELGNQLRMLNHRVSSRLAMRDIDLDCLNIVQRHGPLSLSTLSRRTGLHPATMTGIVDRLERGGWIARERDPADRRTTLIRAQPEREPQILHLYTGMNAAIDGICETYDDAELKVLADFLSRCIAASRMATETLTPPGGDSSTVTA